MVCCIVMFGLVGGECLCVVLGGILKLGCMLFVFKNVVYWYVLVSGVMCFLVL